MEKSIVPLFLIAALGLLTCGAYAQIQVSSPTAVSPAPAAKPELPPEYLLLPPAFPAHEKRQLNGATEVAKDLADTVSFLEQGQTYFRACQKGTHNAQENTAFLKLVQAYEQERETAKKEMELLRRWVLDRSALDAPALP